MLAALLLAALPQQGWQVEELPQPPTPVLTIAADGEDLYAVGEQVHRLRPGDSSWTRIADVPPEALSAVGAHAEAGGGVLAFHAGPSRITLEDEAWLFEPGNGSWRRAPRAGLVDATALVFDGVPEASPALIEKFR